MSDQTVLTISTTGDLWLRSCWVAVRRDPGGPRWALGGTTSALRFCSSCWQRLLGRPPIRSSCSIRSPPPEPSFGGFRLSQPVCRTVCGEPDRHAPKPAGCPFAATARNRPDFPTRGDRRACPCVAIDRRVWAPWLRARYLRVRCAATIRIRQDPVCALNDQRAHCRGTALPLGFFPNSGWAAFRGVETEEHVALGTEDPNTPFDIGDLTTVGPAVRLTGDAAVPEPAPLALLATGLLVVLTASQPRDAARGRHVGNGGRRAPVRSLCRRLTLRTSNRHLMINARSRIPGRPNVGRLLLRHRPPRRVPCQRRELSTETAAARNKCWRCQRRFTNR